MHRSLFTVSLPLRLVVVLPFILLLLIAAGWATS